MTCIGISNFEIEKIIRNSSNDGLCKNFVGAFPSNKINHYMDFRYIMREKKDGKYPFLIANTDRSDKSGSHWWGILDISKEQNIFL